MKIIVTGATGFIGGRLCRALLERGHEVVALSRSRKSAEVKLGPQVQVAEWDGRSAESWSDQADGADAIVNLAGENIGAARWTQSRREALLSSRLDSGRAVVDAVRKAKRKPSVLIQASGIGIYGNAGDAIVDETAAPGQGFLAELALRWEDGVRPVEQAGVRLVFLRTSAVLDDKEGALPKMLLPFRFFAGGPVGSGKQWFPWIHVQDEVNAILFLLERADLKGPFNLAAPGETRQREFAKALGKAIGRPAWVPAPSFALRMLLGEMADELLLAGQRAKPQRLQEAGFVFRFPELSAALADLLARRQGNSA
ncbi:MAG: TIGR01777 family protein [Myxococcales bacterium]|nr:TIGR01777 family protein [Myxococcales bacterium]